MWAYPISSTWSARSFQLCPGVDPKHLAALKSRPAKGLSDNVYSSTSSASRSSSSNLLVSIAIAILFTSHVKTVVF